MRLIDKLVCKNLKLNKKRTIVTIIGIILAVSLLSAVSTMAVCFQKSMITYQKEKSGDYHVSFSGVTNSDLTEFDENRSIDHYFTINNIGYALLKDCKNVYKPYCRIISTDSDGFAEAEFKLVEGRMPENEDEIVIPRHLKTNGRIEYKVGQDITLDVGQRVNKEDGSKLDESVSYEKENEDIVNKVTKSYKVVGIIERPVYGCEGYECPAYTFVTCSSERGNDMTLYASFTQKGLKNAEEIATAICGIDSELFEKINDTKQDATDEEYEEYNRQLRKAKYQCQMNSTLISYERIWPVNSSFVILYNIAFIVAAIIILTSVYCIKNSFDISISEKIRQYGMLSSIGATKKQIKKSVHTEAAIMGVIGIPIGLICGMFAAFVLIQVCNVVIGDVISIHFGFYPSIIAVVVATLLGIITVYFSAASSARKAGKVSPMEAIRNQREIAFNSKSIKTPKYINKIWGIGGVISYKNIKRNKKKYRTTVVSIVICTVTFIVVSYVMSMFLELFTMSYANDEYNVSFGMTIVDGTQFDVNQIKNLDNIDWCEIAQVNDMEAENPEYTDEYNSYLKQNEIADETTYIQIVALDDESFKKYAKNYGILNTDDEIILVNRCVKTWEEDGKVKTGELDTFKYKAGDEMELSRVDDSDAQFDDDGNVIENSLKNIKYNIKISKIADDRPTGYKGNKDVNLLVMNQKTAIAQKLVSGKRYEAYFISGDADKLQDELENMVSVSDNVSYSVYNRDKNERDERVLFQLLEIFAYGFITVIALIGITNIINTLNTSMELRSREFATLRSIGMTDSQFKRMVRLESFFTSAKSLTIGIIVGILISYMINWIECSHDTSVMFKLPLFSIILCIVVVMVLIYIIISVSMKRISSKNIIETIKNENL